MDISSDYKNLFKILNRYKVRYLVIGAYAVVFYTEPRFTKDLDLWAGNDGENAERLYRGLTEFGAPLKGLRASDFTDKNMVYQIGVAPIRIDIIMGIPGLEFDHAWKNRKKTEYGGTAVNMLGIKELICSKRRAGREQDILDLKKLTRRKTK